MLSVELKWHMNEQVLSDQGGEMYKQTIRNDTKYEMTRDCLTANFV